MKNIFNRKINILMMSLLAWLVFKKQTIILQITLMKDHQMLRITLMGRPLLISCFWKLCMWQTFL